MYLTLRTSDDSILYLSSFLKWFFQRAAGVEKATIAQCRTSVFRIFFGRPPRRKGQQAAFEEARQEDTDSSEERFLAYPLSIFFQIVKGQSVSTGDIMSWFLPVFNLRPSTVFQLKAMPKDRRLTSLQPKNLRIQTLNPPGLVMEMGREPNNPKPKIPHQRIRIRRRHLRLQGVRNNQRRRKRRRSTCVCGLLRKFLLLIRSSSITMSVILICRRKGTYKV